MAYHDLRGNPIFGVKACTAIAFDHFRADLVADFDKGWGELMEYDWASARSYLTREGPQYPLSVVQWFETRNGGGTGSFDRSLSEVSMSLSSKLTLHSHIYPDHTSLP